MQIFQTFIIAGFHMTSSKFKLRIVDLDILSFYFHEALFTNFQFERVLRSMIGYATISKVATMRAAM